VEGDYPKFAREVGTGRPRRKSDAQIWEDLKRHVNSINDEFHRNPYGLIPGLIEDERVAPGSAYAVARGMWSNPLLEELKERRSAEVAGALLKWPSLREGTRETDRQFHEHMMEWAQDYIVVQFDGVGNELYVHSRWGVLRDDIGKPRQAVEQDRRSGARYWPIGKV